MKLQNISIADNIAMGHPGAGRGEILRAATVAQIHDEIVAMPLGCETVLSELAATSRAVSSSASPSLAR